MVVHLKKGGTLKNVHEMTSGRGPSGANCSMFFPMRNSRNMSVHIADGQQIGVPSRGCTACVSGLRSIGR